MGVKLGFSSNAARSIAVSLAAVSAGLSTASADDSADDSNMTAANGWSVVWRDDFDDEALDRSNWAPEVSCWGGGNNERQCYTDRPENVRVEDGVLHLIGQPEQYTGPVNPPELRVLGEGQRTQEYTSGKVRTRGLHSWRYGRFSARMKAPSGQGVWPAFWMMSAHDVYGRWPLSGEIDIMEAVNTGTPCEDCPTGVELRTSGALHFGGISPANTYFYNKTWQEGDDGPAEEWCVYTLEWADNVMQWFVDGEIFMRLTADQWFTEAVSKDVNPTAPFDQPFYLMINLAVGGELPEHENGGGFDPSTFPASLLVDWVQVEQCADDLQTGRACLSDAPWSGEPLSP